MLTAEKMDDVIGSGSSSDEYKRILDLIAASNPCKLTLSEWHTFRCIDRYDSLWATKEECHAPNLDYIRDRMETSWVIVCARVERGCEMYIDSYEYHLGDPPPKVEMPLAKCEAVFRPRVGGKPVYLGELDSMTISTTRETK